MAGTDGSNLIKDGDKLATYHYKLTEFMILIDGEKDEIPLERIFNIKIENYFEDAVFPIFKIELPLEPSRYYKMIKNKEKVKFKVRIQMYYTINDNPDEKSMLRDYINDTFIFFPDEDDSDFVEDIKTEETKDDLNVLEKLGNNIELFLFKDCVTNLRTPCNYVFNSITTCTAVTYLLYKAGINKVLMSPFENTKTYSQLVLPPQSVEANIRYLNNNFGFYKKGGIVFFGFFHNYILNCKEGCTAWYKKEWTDSIIYVLAKSNSKSSIDGAFIRPDEEKFYTLIQPEAISVDNAAVTQNVTGGTDAQVIDMKANSTSTFAANATELAKNVKATIFNNTSNDYLGTTLAAQTKSNNTILTAMVDNINIEAFNPNKKISVVFENQTQNKKYGGTYRIASSVFTFAHSTADFTVSALLTLKKVD